MDYGQHFAINPHHSITVTAGIPVALGILDPRKLSKTIYVSKRFFDLRWKKGVGKLFKRHVLRVTTIHVQAKLKFVMYLSENFLGHLVAKLKMLRDACVPMPTKVP